MPAPMRVTAPATGLCENAALMMSSLEKNPAKGGMPMIANVQIPKVAKVMTMTARRAPSLRILIVSLLACITEPAPRNSPALKKPWVSRWKMAKT
ncbi:unannotated protein [freshwater metagenome]|uniref:Unannotated protein n=1 Tax=freshwater metagenome TaxID=449393 RepID=A0A6J7P786_9ZZZZ